MKRFFALVYVRCRNWKKYVWRLGTPFKPDKYVRNAKFTKEIATFKMWRRGPNVNLFFSMCIIPKTPWQKSVWIVNINESTLEFLYFKGPSTQISISNLFSEIDSLNYLRGSWFNACMMRECVIDKDLPVDSKISPDKHFLPREIINED